MPAVLRWAIALTLFGALVFWTVTRPDALAEDALAGLTPDLAQGALVFHAAGCASCHTAPEADTPEDGGEEAGPVLAGGRPFASDFGTFYAPNISPDPVHGIGGWSALDLANAMRHGVSPDGAHYYPAFPYTSYAKAELSDIVSLHAYMQELPVSQRPNRPHEIGFPFNIRRLLGGWKWLYHGSDWVMTGDLSPEETRGRYLAEALSHCGECHTPRDALGGLDTAAWMAGAPNPSGTGRIPNITPAKLFWSARDIAEYLSSGFTPEFDTAGGSMVAVVENIARLPQADRDAIAAYVKRLAPVE